MKLFVAVTTLLALLLGAYIGYRTAGVGGAIFYGALIGVGGTLLGSLLARRVSPSARATGAEMDLTTWSPFQSDEAREICAHMTADERIRAAGRGALYGLWVLASVVAPLGVAWRSQFLWAWVLASVAVLVHVALIPTWQQRAREFLCSTQWAQDRGLTTDLKLFRFRR